MNRLQITLFAGLVLAGLLLTAVVLRNRQPPLLPADEAHTTVSGHEDCMVCHDAEGVSPRSRNHPIGNDCLRCHGRP